VPCQVTGAPRQSRMWRDPSWNTDQGARAVCEVKGFNPGSEAKATQVNHAYLRGNTPLLKRG